VKKDPFRDGGVDSDDRLRMPFGARARHSDESFSLLPLLLLLRFFVLRSRCLSLTPFVAESIDVNSIAASYAPKQVFSED
jgi:hypothetical protein